MKIIVGSLNPVKIGAVANALESVWNEITVVGIEVESGVPDQPFNEDTYTGAKNRVKQIIAKNILNDSDYAIGIEGGIFSSYNRYIAKGIVCIGNNKGEIAFGESAGFELPEKVMTEIHKGLELGKVIDMFTGEVNTKKKDGAIGYLTNNLVTRTELYKMGIIAAVIPFINRNLYYQ